MKRPDYILSDLICDFINYIVAKRVIPDMEIESVTDLSLEQIDQLMENNIKGLIIDVDETLRFNGGDIPYENEEWLNMVRDKLKILILSNGWDRKLETKFGDMDIDYVHSAIKPLKHYFKKSLSMLELEPHEVAVIGDSLFDDINGGKRSNMTTIKVSGGKKLIKKIGN